MNITLGRKHQQGIAIVVVMVSIFVLAVLAGGFAYNMKVETRLAMNGNNETELEWMGRSGVEMARYVLGMQMRVGNEPYDSLNQKWAGGSGGTNDALADLNLTDVELGHGKFSVKITDTERKFNINTALRNEAVLQHALILIGVDAAEIPTIISSIQDWIDPNDDTSVNGAETEYYQGQDPPYMAKNGPIDDISELLFIKGITPDIYWGPNSTNHPANPFQNRFDSTRSGLIPVQLPVQAGLVDLFTPISNGLINILTASETQLQMIPGVDENIAGEIIQRRDEAAGSLDGRLPYRAAADLLRNTSLGQQFAGQVAQYCTLRSSTFEVDVDAEVGQTHRHYYALLRRNTPNDIQILNFHWVE